MATGPTGGELVRIPIFAGLPAPLLDRLARLTGLRCVSGGELLFAEGDKASFLPLLLAGQVKLVRVGPDGREQVLHLVRAPASFAEAAVFGPGVFPASAVALRSGQLAVIPRATLLDLVARQPEVALALLASMSIWMRRLAGLVEELSLHSVEERVASYLLGVLRRSGHDLVAGLTVPLEDPKHLIAALCGTAPEVLSRTFRRLEADGVVRVVGPVVTLLDPRVLDERAGRR